MQGLNLGIDFTGGSLLDVKFNKPVQIEQIRGVLNHYNVGNEVPIQESGSNEYIIRTRALSQEESNQVTQELQDKLGKMEVMRNDKVGPEYGKELVDKAIYSVIIACVLMLIYITIRFEFKFGVAAIAGLVHDVLIIIGIFSLFRLEVDSSFVAAVLTILGYSIMDTIVVFDRIRENMKFKRKENYHQLVDKSILQTINRSINTVLTVVFCLAALLVFGGATIKYFVIALLIGVISGCYSSIFVASPIWYDLKTREGN
jgi:preprotein translocase subunit SecF